MSLTLPAVYSAASKQGNIQENWIVQLYYDGSGSTFTPIALGSTTVGSVFYHGVITNKPSVRETINLVSSTAKVSNISLDLVNFQYKGDDFSAELLAGTRTYINNDVKIYVQLNGDSTLANCLHIYTGRLYGIQHGDDKIRLSIKSRAPWDRVDYPDVFSAEKILAPLSFGTFAGNDSTFPGVGTDNWRPAPFTNTDINGSNYVIGVVADTSLTPAKYLSTYDGFVPYLSGSEPQDSRTVSGVEVVDINELGFHTFEQSPVSDTQSSSGASITEANMSNVYDGDTSTSGTITLAASFIEAPGSLNETHQQAFTIAQTEDDALITLKYQVTTFTSNGFTSPVAQIQITTANGNSSTVTKTGTDGSVQTLQVTVSDAITSITVKTQFTGAGAEGSSFSAVITLKELSASVTRDDGNIETIYVAAGGELKSYTGGSVANIHEAHRSLLHDALALTDTPTGWSALDTERVGSPNAWTILYWQNEQEPIEDLLKLLQYEGQFIYIYQRAAGRYIFIADSPSSIATLTKEDIAGFSINQVNFDELETKHIIDYSPHPAKDEYRSQATQTSGDRGDYNFAAGENIITVTLHALAAAVSGGSARNDDWATYRQKLFGSIKLTVQFSLINPAYSNLEVGDIIDFSSMTFDPGGGSWSGKYFIIIQTRRKPGNISVIAREV